MIRREVLLGLVFLSVGLIATVAAGLLIVSEIRSGRAERELRQSLEEADRLIAADDLDGAAELLRAASAKARSGQDWLSIAKPAYRIAERRGDYAAAAELLNHGAEAVPDASTLRAVATHASLRAGRLETADRLLSASAAPESERFEALRAELRLRQREAAETERTAHGRGEAAAGPGGAAGGPGVAAATGVRILGGLSRRSSAEAFETAYDLTGDGRFALNAALRYAATGEHDTALETLTARELAGEYPVCTALLAYDLEDYERYEQLLRSMDPATAVSAEQMMLQADIAMHRGSFSEAGTIYADVRESAPAFAPEQYLNGAWLARNDPTKAREILAQRDGRFDSDTGIVHAEVMLAYSDDPDTARKMISSRLVRVDDPSFLETLRMHLFGRERGTVSSFVSRMWVLANRYDGQAEPLRYLGWYLVSVGDWAELELLVGRLERQKVEAAAAEQARLYRGILAARREAWKEAEESFGSAAPTWQASFDAGLAALADGRATESHAYFETAISQLEDPALRVAARDRDAARAVVLIFDGLAYGVGGRYAEAYRRVSRAAELDPESTRARYLVGRFADRL